MGWFARWRHRDDTVEPDLDMNGRHVHTPGTFIDSWQNMPGGQPDDDHRPTVSELKGWTRPDDQETST